MAISSAEVIKRSEVLPSGRKSAMLNSSSGLVLRNDNIGKPDFSLITENSARIERPVIIFQEKPLDPLELPLPLPEPAPWSASAKEWKHWEQTRDEYVNYIRRRDTARAFTLENDLRGTF